MVKVEKPSAMDEIESRAQLSSTLHGLVTAQMLRTSVPVTSTMHMYLATTEPLKIYCKTRPGLKHGRVQRPMAVPRLLRRTMALRLLDSHTMRQVKHSLSVDWVPTSAFRKRSMALKLHRPMRRHLALSTMPT